MELPLSPCLKCFTFTLVNELTIKMDNDAYTSFTITNNVGQTLIQQQLNTSLTKVNVKTLSRGATQYHSKTR